MRNDTPPPMDNADEYQDDIFLNEDDIEIIDFETEDFEIEEEFGPVLDFEPLPVHDDANLTFAAHTGAVFCCEIDKSCGVAVSGGEDDRGFIWDIATGETVLECSGHKDSVISVGFNHNKTLVATADMRGVIQVWDIQNKNRVWEFETSDLTWLEWHKQSNVLLAGTQDGDTWMWRVPQGEFKTFRSHGSASSYGRIMPDGCRSVVGYDDGSVRFWDLKKSTFIQTIVDQRSQDGPVTTIDCNPDNVLVVTGSTEGVAKLIKSTNGRVLASFNCGEEQVSGGVRTDSIESVSFFNSHSLLATGTLRGSLAIWDLPTQVQRLQCKQESAIIKLLCDRTDPLVFTAGMDGIIRLYDWRTGQVEAKWGGHTSEILDFSLSRDGQTILTASEDKTCKIFAVRQS